MRTGFLAAVGLSLVLVGCGAEELAPTEMGGITVRVQSGISFNMAEVELTRDDGTGSPIVITLAEVGNTWVGSQDLLAPGRYWAQLRVLHSSEAPPFKDVGDRARVDVVAGSTATVSFLVGRHQEDPLRRGPAITSISLPSKSIAAETTISILVGATDGVAPLTLTGSAPAAAGFFGVADGVLSIPFTTGTVAGTYDLTLTVEDAAGATDSVVFEIEVTGAPEPGEVEVMVDLNPAPVGTMTVESTFTEADVTVDFTLTAEAFGLASSGMLEWKLSSVPTAPSNTDCARGEFNYMGLTSTGSVSGSGWSPTTISISYHLERPFGTGQCDFIYEVVDSLSGTFKATHRFRLGFRSVNY